MCEFFSCVATRDGRILFTEEDSHEIVIRRANLRDNYSSNFSNFVRLEVLPPFTECLVDQRETPAWFDEDAEVIKDKAVQLANRVALAWEDFQKIVDPAREEYKKVEGPAREEYKKVRDPAREKYLKIVDPAWEEYKKVQGPAWEKYLKIADPAWEEYWKVRTSTYEEYIKHLQKIEGFVK